MEPKLQEYIDKMLNIVETWIHEALKPRFYDDPKEMIKHIEAYLNNSNNNNIYGTLIDILKEHAKDIEFEVWDKCVELFPRQYINELYDLCCTSDNYCSIYDERILKDWYKERSFPPTRLVKKVLGVMGTWNNSDYVSELYRSTTHLRLKNMIDIASVDVDCLLQDAELLEMAKVVIAKFYENDSFPAENLELLCRKVYLEDGSLKWILFNYEDIEIEMDKCRKKIRAMTITE